MWMKRLFGGLLAVASGVAAAATNDLTSTLQKGLFEEEANHNLDAAIQLYQSVVNRFDADRKLAATAVFRLGECYRKRGITNDAAAQFERIVREFPDQDQLANLSRQTLAGWGRARTAGSEAEAGDLRAGTLLQEATMAKQEAAVLRAQLTRLERLENNDRRIAIQQEFPNPVMISLMQKLAEEEQKLAALQKTFGPENGSVIQEAAVVETVNKQIDAQVRGVLSGLSAKAKSLEAKEQALAQYQAVAAPGPASSSEPVPATSTETEEVKRIQGIIKDSPDLINAKDPTTSRTPLQQAANKGQLVVAQFLLNNGADVNAPGPNGYRPLHFAAVAGHKAMVDLLLSRGADIEARDSSGETALHPAARNGFKNVVEALLKNKADVNAKNSRGWTSLHVAASSGQMAIAELLLTSKGDVNAKNSPPPDNNPDPNRGWRTGGATPLVEAILERHVDLAKLLLANRAEVNFDCDIWLNLSGGLWGVKASPLYLATHVNSLEIAQLLLKAGADPNAPAAQFREGRTPLLAAASDNHPDIVSLLLSFKADPNATDVRGYCAMHYAVWNHLVELAQLLITNKANVDCRGLDGQTPLHFAARNGQPDLATLLLAHHADPNAKDNNGDTPLHLAVQNGYKNIVESLLGSGADANLANNAGLTPLALTRAQPNTFPASPGAVTLPAPPLRGLRVPSSTPSPRPSPEDIALVLRQHGALDDLPRADAIQIRRSSTGFRGNPLLNSTNGWNRFTLLEVLGAQYNLLTLNAGYSSVSRSQLSLWATVQPLPYPDLTRVRIRRPGSDGKSWQERVVNLSPILNDGDCSKDVVLDWGDVVDIPEADHPLGSAWEGFSPAQFGNLKKCLSREVDVTVKGQTTKLKLSPDIGSRGSSPGGPPVIGSGVSYWIKPALRNSNLLLVSSDLSRIKVTRNDPATGQKREYVLDCSDDKPAPDFWLRDGDAIEVPDRN